MAALRRTWPPLFAMGAGLLHVALGASVLAGRPVAAALLVLAVLVLLGMGELAWGVASLGAGRPLTPRTAVGGAGAGTVAAGVAIAAGASPFAAAGALVLSVTAGVFVARGTARVHEAKGPDRPWLSTAGMLAGAILVAALVTPALSTTAVAAHLDHHLPTGVQDPHAGH